MSKTILTDIEGTITSLSFVKDTLFPYSKEYIKDYILDNYEHEPKLFPIIDSVLEEVKEGNADGISYDPTQADIIIEAQLYTAIQALLQWLAEDRKITPLKELQGLIWEEGYRKGAYKGHLYDDAYEWLKNEKEAGTKIYVYSSGSVKAQELLFEYSKFGDIKELFDGFFDTKIGSKKVAESYKSIALKIGIPPREITFYSDIEEELKAAAEAGLEVVQVRRKEDYQEPIKSEYKLIEKFE
ncbi:MAG: acireductone synthase [Candidatus Caenarcaniphilales bacterium]|nr:acireductone synthase [Candidatus Caenarcaniphilales bacterium]